MPQFTLLLFFGFFTTPGYAQGTGIPGEAFGPEYPFKLLLALLLVLLVFFALVWVGKRFRQLPAGKSRIRILEGVSVGNREKLVLVEVNEQQILLGVTANSISALHHAAKASEEKDGFASVVRRELAAEESSS